MINKRYEIIKKIGQGRSAVYMCKDAEFMDAEIAIKVLSSGANDVEREYFRSEYFTLKKLDHPNIIRALEIGTILEKSENDDVESGVPFITLEYFPSSELLQSVFIRNELSLKIILNQICSVLYYLHQSNYIYYDLKPENILVANPGGNPVIKLIDLGFAQLGSEELKNDVKGTAQYIAPELLKKEEHDHRVDLYSLGMMLYRIIYDRFPFNSSDELAIYKSKLENEFDFPLTKKFSNELIEVVKKLLAKNPEDRFQNALQVLSDLEIEVDDSITKDFLPAKVFSDRTDVLNILFVYINDKTSSEAFTLKGFDGAGKTAILNRVHEIYPGSVMVSNQKGKSGIKLIKYLLKEIVFSKSVYDFLSTEELTKINSLTDESDSSFVLRLPEVISLIAKKTKFILLIDDFNLLDDLSSEILSSIIPIFQVNSIKIILAETADNRYKSTEINNVRDVLLSSFTDVQVTEFIKQSYSASFPREELINLIVKYADLLPGSIVSFIKDLILLGIVRHLPSGVEINKNEEAIRVLKSSHEVLYDYRLKNFSKTELKVVQIISALDVVIEMNTLVALLDIPFQKISDIVFKLQVYNVLQHFTSGSSLLITSDGFKKHIYSSVKNKTGLHLVLAERIKKNLQYFNRSELARHYELAGKYDLCYETMCIEIEDVEKHSAYSYMKKILEHLAGLPLRGIKKTDVKIKLCDVYYKMSDYQSALEVINSLEGINLDDKVQTEIQILKSSSLFNVGKFDEAKKMLNELLKRKVDVTLKHKIFVEMAYAEFEQKIYDEASRISKSLLKDKKLSFELRGRCHNLLGMCYIYKNNDLHSALTEFMFAIENYKQAGLPRRVAGVEVNVGNIFNILGIHSKAEEHWNRASDINESIGNLEQEGLILLNTGIYYYNHQKFDRAVENYKNAIKIFLSLGNQINQGLVLYNLAEVYMIGCEYQHVFNSLQQAMQIFEANENDEELAEVLYLYGNFYNLIGSMNRMRDILDRFRKLIEEKNLLPKHKYSLKYIDALYKILDNKFPEVSGLKSIRDAFVEMDERNKYTEVNFTIIKVLIDQKNYEQALNEINDKVFIEIINQNSILESQREYFLAKIASVYESERLSPPIEYLERAYELIKDESITELTWKVLLMQSDIYIERGNFNRAKGFFIYAKELINFIAENIQSPQLRNSYINQKDVKLALEKIEAYSSV